ncbi:MAG: thiol:disulfide interchange protein DsbA/DsbL [Thiotrichaceae bacterium]|nr:thiol:disulfide interchange protein DsbA/DsbL [Thiotrichaceae bacterium]
MKLPTIKAIVLISFFSISLYGCFSNDGQAENTESQVNATAQPAQAVREVAKKPAAPSPFIEGKHYFKLSPPLNTSTEEGKIEVLELFWLGCPHCYSLEPAMKRFKDSKPDDVSFEQIPATLNPSWFFHAKVFYTAKMLDPTASKGLIHKLFVALHEKRIKINKPSEARELFLESGISAMQFNNTFNSMAMSAKMSHANLVSSGSQAQSVPTLIINGKYRTSPYSAGGEGNLLKILNMLIQRERELK